MRLPPAFRSVSVIYALTVICGCSVLVAQSSISPPTAQTQSSSDANAPGAYAKEPYVFELIEKTVRFEADGKGQRDLTFRIRIQSESAVREYGLIVYPFASRFENLEVDYVRVHKPDGTVLETPASDVQEIESAVSRAAPMYTDEHEKHIAVKALAVGDILEAHLRWIIHEPFAPGHFWYDHQFYRAGVCLRELLTIDVPKNIAVKLRSSNNITPTVREDGVRRIYAFQRSNLSKQPESKIPEWERNAHGAPPPEVQLSSFSSWEEVGKWFGGLDQPKVQVTPEIQAKAEELTKGKATEDEKVRSLYEFVSTRFRYIGIDLGHSRYTPHAAPEVLQNRYGDCKDKQVLLAALLRAVGIRSYPALISSSFAVDPAFPTMSLFDHVITAVPRGDSVQFLDATPEVAPFGFLTINLRDRKSLVIPDRESPQLLSTPKDPPLPSYELFRSEASLSADGTLDAKMHLENRGDTELALRLAYHAIPQNRWDKFTQDFASSLGFGGNVSDVVIGQPDDTSKPFVIEFSYRRTNYPYWKDRRVTLPMPPFFLHSLTEEQKQSANPLPLGTLANLTYEIVLKFPDGYKPFMPVKTFEQKKDFAEFSGTYALDKDTVRGTFRLKTLLRDVPATERLAFSAFSDAVGDAMRRYVFVAQPGNRDAVAGVVASNPRSVAAPKDVTILPPSSSSSPSAAISPEEQARLNSAQTLLDAALRAEKKNDYSTAAQILEQVVAKDPKRQFAWTSLGYCYNNLQQYGKAEAALRKAIELNPADKFAYNSLGNALIGQKKYEESIPQFQKQIEMVPDDKWAHTNLGRAYMLTKNFGKAADELERAAKLTPDDPAIHFALGRSYLHSDRRDKGLIELQKSVDLEPIPARWNVAAFELAQDKVALDKAERYADSAIESTSGRLRDLSLESLSNEDALLPATLAGYWDTLGCVKFQQGDLPSAEKFILSAWQLRTIGEIGDHLGQVIEKTGRKQEAIDTYALALAANLPNPDTGPRLSRLVEKNVDVKALIETARSKLVKLQTISLKNSGNLDGEAEFWLLVEHGPKVTASKFVSGDDALRAIAEELKTLVPDFRFPDASDIKIPRRAKVNCSRLSGNCNVRFVSSEAVRAAN